MREQFAALCATPWELPHEYLVRARLHAVELGLLPPQPVLRHRARRRRGFLGEELLRHGAAGPGRRRRRRGADLRGCGR
jgi:hypothetical protein